MVNLFIGTHINIAQYEAKTFVDDCRRTVIILLLIMTINGNPIAAT